MEIKLCDHCQKDLLNQEWLEIQVLHHPASAIVHQHDCELTTYHDICGECFVKIGLKKMKL